MDILKIPSTEISTQPLGSPRTNARWQLNDFSIKASDKDWKNYRLTAFNEKIQILLSEIIQQQQFEKIDSDKNQTKDLSYVAPHLQVGLGIINPIVLTVGDPFRTVIVAQMCEKAQEIKWNREYRMFNVTFEGVDITVVSHGIGGPGAAICFEELIKLGATTIIRMGTCGSLKPNEIKQGDLVVSAAACREDGHSQFIVPAGFPAHADPRLSIALFDQAKSLGYKVHMGVTLTQGTFYNGPAVASTLQINADAGALSVEMENATLFCIGSVRGIRTGAIAVIDGSPFNWEKGDYDPLGSKVSEGKNKMILTGLKVAKKIFLESQNDVQHKNQEDHTQFKHFDPSETLKYIEFFRNNNIYDYVQSIESLNIKQKAKLLDFTQKGIQTNLQFYMLAADLQMDEDQMKNILILFYKVKKNLDADFIQKSSGFIQQYLNERDGPEAIHN